MKIIKTYDEFINESDSKETMSPAEFVERVKEEFIKNDLDFEDLTTDRVKKNGNFKFKILLNKYMTKINKQFFQIKNPTIYPPSGPWIVYTTNLQMKVFNKLYIISKKFSYNNL